MDTWILWELLAEMQTAIKLAVKIFQELPLGFQQPGLGAVCGDKEHKAVTKQLEGVLGTR